MLCDCISILAGGKKQCMVTVMQSTIAQNSSSGKGEKSPVLWLGNKDAGNVDIPNLQLVIVDGGNMNLLLSIVKKHVRPSDRKELVHCAHGLEQEKDTTIIDSHTAEGGGTERNKQGSPVKCYPRT